MNLKIRRCKILDNSVSAFWGKKVLFGGIRKDLFRAKMVDVFDWQITVEDTSEQKSDLKYAALGSFVCLPADWLMFLIQITVEDTSELMSDSKNMLCCDWFFYILLPQDLPE